MALVKFILDAPTNTNWSLDTELVHVLDLEKTPYPVKASISDGLLVCQTSSPDSLRVQVPWALPGRNPVIMGTSTLPSRNEPYLLVLELARGRLTELRHYFQEGPATSPHLLPEPFQEAHRVFVQALMNRGNLQECVRLATRSIELSLQLAESLMKSTVNENLLNSKIADKFSVDLTQFRSSEPDSVVRWGVKTATRCRVSPTWAELMPVENQIHWASWEAPVKLAFESGHQVHAGPLVDFSADSLPPWLFRYDDIMQLTRVVANYVFYVVRNLKNHVHVWHVVRRPAMGPIHNLTEEQQIKITVAAIQAVAQAAPDADIVIDLSSPWAEWLSHARNELGPLHLADTLARADLGLTGICLDLALGYPNPGSHLRELFDISKLFDLYRLINLPLHLNLAIPGKLISKGDHHKVGETAAILPDPRQWPVGCHQELQKQIATDLIRMAADRSFVQSIHWSCLSEGMPSEYPGSGLFSASGEPTLLANELERLIKSTLV
ncbi:MAG: hypothetical protein RJA81_1717 [Planctomycetota bacterium]